MAMPKEEKIFLTNPSVCLYGSLRENFRSKSKNMSAFGYVYGLDLFGFVSGVSGFQKGIGQ